MDGKSVKVPNALPTAYNNVKVWAAQGNYYPVSNALFKGFVFEPKSE